MKKLLLIPCIVFLFTGISFAQYPGMAAFNRQMNQDFIIRQMNMTMNMQMNMLNNRSYYNPKYDFSVMMKDSTLKEVNSSILYDTTAHKSYLEYINKSVPKADPKRKQKIYVDQTLQITRLDANDIAITGMAKDTCWLFKVAAGPIAAYSYMADSYHSVKPWTIIAIQNEKGPIVPFKPENLKPMITADPQAMKLFDKKKYYEALMKYNKNVIKTYH